MQMMIQTKLGIAVENVVQVGERCYEQKGRRSFNIMFNFKRKKLQDPQMKAFERKTDSLFYYFPFFVFGGVWIFVVATLFGLRLFAK